MKVGAVTVDAMLGHAVYRCLLTEVDYNND
jgi:hypothetical protein